MGQEFTLNKSLQQILNGKWTSSYVALSYSEHSKRLYIQINLERINSLCDIYKWRINA